MNDRQPRIPRCVVSPRSDSAAFVVGHTMVIDGGQIV
jgi:hypothetical protein